MINGRLFSKILYYSMNYMNLIISWSKRLKHTQWIDLLSILVIQLESVIIFEKHFIEHHILLIHSNVVLEIENRKSVVLQLTILKSHLILDQLIYELFDLFNLFTLLIRVLKRVEVSIDLNQSIFKFIILLKHCQFYYSIKIHYNDEWMNVI